MTHREIYGAYLITQSVFSAILVLLTIAALIVTLRGTRYIFVLTVLTMILISNIATIANIKFYQELRILNGQKDD